MQTSETFMYKKRERPTGIKTFSLDEIVYTSIHPNAQWTVYLENRCYAGFDTEQEAKEAVELWSKYWPAAKGKKLTILPKLS